MSDIIPLLDDDDEENVINLIHSWQRKRMEYLRKLRRAEARKKRVVVVRDREQGYSRIYNDYLCATPKYTETQFRRRFRMSSTLFNRIYNDLREKEFYFQEKSDGIGRRGVSPLQKIVAALRMITYGESADRQDEYSQISEGTARMANINFCEGIVKLYGKEYLRRPTEEDLTRILTVNAIRGFPGMIGTTVIMLRCHFSYSDPHYSTLFIYKYLIISRLLLVL